MSDESKARLSALMDGEATWCPEDLAQCRDNPEAVDCWQSYHLIRDVLQDKHHAPSLDTDTASAVMLALKDEPPIFAPTALNATSESSESSDQPVEKAVEAAAASVTPIGTASARNRKPYTKPALGFAIAASVAMASFVLVQNSDLAPGGAPQPAIASAPTENAGSSTAISNVVATRTVGQNEVGLVSDSPLGGVMQSAPALNTIDASQHAALEQYTLQHLDQEAQFSLTGTLPAARLVTHATAE